MSFNILASECSPVAFPIKNKNYSNADAHKYFKISKRSNLKNYWYQSVLSGDDRLKNLLYKYLKSTSSSAEEKAYIELIQKNSIKFKTKKQICRLHKSNYS